MRYKISATLRKGMMVIPPDTDEFQIERVAFDEGMRDDIVGALNTLGAVQIVTVNTSIQERN